MTDRRKLVLCVVDSLRTDLLQQAVADGVAPTFGALLERGELIEDCVSSFPSVTPVCCSDIVTGRRPDGHWISGSNWYHRAERRYVEYGSSFEATRAFGLFRTLYDIVYNMNMSHLSHEVETVFEQLGDAGVRTACTPFLIYRGRTRHELGLEGLLRRVALAASFRHATWGPDELFYGELYSSRRVPCKPTLARPGTRDEYSACVGRELVAEDLYDFLLFSLPDNDYHSHKFGPDAQVDSIARADAAFAELAVSPIARAGGVYVLGEGRRASRAHEAVRDRLEQTAGIDLVTWLATADGSPVVRAQPGPGDGAEAVVERGGAELRFRPGDAVRDRRGQGWDVAGELAVLEATVDGDGVIASEVYPDPLARVWAALNAPHSGDLIVSAELGHELVDWGGVTHCPGGSHGSLHAGDSLGPLLFCGLPAETASRREQWNLGDVAELVLEHYRR